MNARNTRHPVDVYLLGTGILATVQFTEETVQALTACRLAFVLHDDLDVHRRIARMGPKVHDMADAYVQGGQRREIYSSIAHEVVEAAAAGGGPVAFVVHGHPLFLVSASEYLLELAQERRLVARALPGVSSFDTLLTDLGIDLGYGVQIFDATSLLEQGWLPSPAIPALVFQLSTTLVGDVVSDTGPETVAPLVEQLLRVYPVEHACTVLHSVTHVLDVPQARVAPLGELPSDPQLELWRRPTLYLPALAGG